MLEEGPGRLEPTSEGSTSVMRLKLEMEEKKQAMVLLQKALVTAPPWQILRHPWWGHYCLRPGSRARVWPGSTTA